MDFEPKVQMEWVIPLNVVAAQANGQSHTSGTRTKRGRSDDVRVPDLGRGRDPGTRCSGEVMSMRAPEGAEAPSEFSRLHAGKQIEIFGKLRGTVGTYRCRGGLDFRGIVRFPRQRSQT